MYIYYICIYYYYFLVFFRGLSGTTIFNNLISILTTKKEKWINCFRNEGLLLCFDTDERLNLPDPIKAQPCPPLGVQGRGQGHSQGLVQGSQPCPPLGVLDRVQGLSKGQGQGQAHVLGQSGQVPNHGLGQKVQSNTDSPPAGFTSQVLKVYRRYMTYRRYRGYRGYRGYRRYRRTKGYRSYRR